MSLADKSSRGGLSNPCLSTLSTEGCVLDLLLGKNLLAPFPGTSSREKFQIVKPGCFGHLSTMQPDVINMGFDDYAWRHTGYGNHHTDIFALG